MRPSRKQTFRTLAVWPATNVRLALLVITVFICCAIIGAPVMSSVERSKSHMAAAAVAAKSSASPRASLTPQSENAQDARKQLNERTSTQDFYAIPYKGSRITKGSPVMGKRAGGVLRPAFNATNVTEVEPNNTTATAQALGVTSAKVLGNLFPDGDEDFYSFTAVAGDRVYAATMTSFSASSTDSQLTLIASNGITIIEFDDDNGAFAGFSSSIAGATIPTTGTYFLKVNDFFATATERPYELWLQVQTGAPTPEVEGNDSPGAANPLPASGWVSGTRNPAAAAEQDWFSITLAAGDTVFLSLDLDPERDSVVWNGRLGFALFGDATNQILVVDDTGTADLIPSEAFFMTVKDAGTYFAFVDSASAAVGGPTATYHLNVTVLPRSSCTTYTSTDVPKTIGPGTGLVSSTITVPGNPRIASMRVNIDLTHAKMADLDVHLRSPAGNDNGLFTDIGAGAIGGQAIMSMGLDDFAGVPPLFTVMKGIVYKPELSYRLGWFRGENAGGTWTLDIRDDNAADGGTLTGWSIEICEEAAPAVCGDKSTPQTVFSTDFEANDGGFTHSGTADEWERGLPATVATSTIDPVAGLSTANSGVNCWKTDLDNTYDASSDQDLFSPNIDLTTFVGPITLTWAQWYQMESATFDHMFVEVQEVGGGGLTRKVFEFLDATMTNSPGSPAVNIGESSGWSLLNAAISDFAGKTIRVRFHLDSDTFVDLAGLAIDDVSVTACAGVVGACTLTCTADVVVSNDPDQCGAVVDYPAPTTTGTCGTVNCSPAAGSFFPIGTTTVNCTASGGQIGAPSGALGGGRTGAPGGGASCSFSVTVQDTQPPSITCPADTTQSNDTDQCGAVVTYPPPTITDNCAGTFTATCIPASGSFFPVGTTTVTCTVDGFGAAMKTTPNGQTCPNSTTITHSSSQTVVFLNSVACADLMSFNTFENSYYRAFTLTSFGIGGAFDVESVDIGVDEAFSGNAAGKSEKSFSRPNKAPVKSKGKGTSLGAPQGGQPLTVNLYTSNQPFPGGFPGSLTLIGTANTTVADQIATIINVPVTGTAPAGSELVVEVLSPDGTIAGNGFFIGSNALPETGPSYVRAPDCGDTTPVTTASIGFPDMHIVLNVNGCPQLVGGPSCSFTVTVNDTQAPSITCPANVTAVTDQNVCPAPACQTVNFTSPVVTDNCGGGGVTVVCNPPSGSCFPVGVTTVNCTATDASGFTTPCSFTVTTFDTALEDDSDPSIILLWNSITGQYRFCCNGVTYTGVGKATIQGCVYTLVHSPADRRILGRVDKAVHAGSGSVQAPPGNIRCTITDRNTLDDPLIPACN